MLKRLTLLIAFSIILPNGGMAQDSLEGYVPPPMFGAQRPIPPKKRAPKAPKMPQISKPADTAPKAVTPYKAKIINTAPIAKTPAIKKAKKKKKKTVIPIKKPTHPKDIFKGKPVEQIPENGHVKKNKITPGVEPIDLLKKQQHQTKRAPSKGIVRGAKTMPSNKKQKVDVEVLFEPKNPTTVTLIDKAQSRPSDEKTDVPELPSINKSFPLPKLKTLNDGSRKLNLIFQETQDNLKDEQAYALDKLIIPQLKENTKTRLQLVSYASPQENSLSGDRRIALSRAMAIRNYITKKGISPSRIDVRSLGAQTDTQPMDRVEITLIN